MSVLLTLAIVASMFVVGAPASAYNAQSEPVEQAWYGIDLPATYTYVVSGNRDDFPNLEDDSVEFHRIIKMIYNLDESAIYAIAEIMDKNNPDTLTVGIFKSTNSGRTWKRLKTGFEGLIDASYQEFGCADIVASTVQSSDIFFTDGVEFHDVLAYLLNVLLEVRHFFLVAHDFQYVSSCNDSQFRVQCFQNMQVPVVYAIKRYGINVL